jgi:hypothetical protein
MVMVTSEEINKTHELMYKYMFKMCSLMTITNVFDALNEGREK